MGGKWGKGKREKVGIWNFRHAEDTFFVDSSYGFRKEGTTSLKKKSCDLKG